MYIYNVWRFLIGRFKTVLNTLFWWGQNGFPNELIGCSTLTLLRHFARTPPLKLENFKSGSLNLCPKKSTCCLQNQFSPNTWYRQIFVWRNHMRKYFFFSFSSSCKDFVMVEFKPSWQKYAFQSQSRSSPFHFLEGENVSKRFGNTQPRSKSSE